MSIKTGVYLHFKGGLYLVTDAVKHTETGEILVIYHNDKARYARPLTMFQETVEHNGQTVQRFMLIKEVIHHEMSCQKILQTDH